MSDAANNKQASVESLLFKNPYVPRSADFGQTPSANALPSAGVLPANLPLWALTGGGLGSLIGAARAEKGKRLRGALRGGAIGTMAGVLGNAGVNAAAGIGDTEMAYHGKPHTEFSTPARIGTVAAPYALGGASALLGGHMMAGTYDKAVQHGEEVSRKYHEDKKKKDAMNTKQSAQKIAKVYEAGESVEGAKPKVVFESHKKCTPCEFGARVKESAGLIGSNPAAEHAALSTNNMHDLRNSGLLPGQEHYSPMATAMSKDPAILNRIGHAQLPTRGSDLLGGTGPNAVLGRLTRDATDDTHQMFKNVQQQYQPRLGAGMTKTQSAFNFGARVKEATTTEAIQALLGMGGAGAGIGALVGAARAPKGKRLRTALGDAAVGGAAGVGLGVGGGAGFAMGHNATSNGDVAPGHYLAGLGSGLGAVGAGALAHKIRNEMEEDYDNNASPLLNAIAKQGSATVDMLKNYPTALRYTLPTTTLVGSLLGAGHGAVSDSGALRGAMRGGLMGAGAGAGTMLAGGLVPTVGSDLGMNSAEIGVPATIGAGVGGGMMGASGGNALYNMLERKYDTERKQIKKEKTAFTFGQKVAFNIDWNALKTPAMSGAALGALAGGVHGLIAPGEDEHGNQRSRFGAMLRRALGGGVLGGLGGAAAGHFAPEQTKKLINSVSMAADPVNYREPTAKIMGQPYPANMRIDPKVRAMYNASQYGTY